jgi:fucose 4-O-acetylase-like acetyltransferase/poly-gamma-glutamate capsule biosynthesis protein CapA/YwtB (metallophosphatase superfamily)/lysophospholipase L1-like esterase
MFDIQNSNVNKNRIYYWDNIKGILISLVVLGHFLLDYLDLGYARHIVSFIYFFHMPAFVFVSGYFSKNEETRANKSIVKIIIIYLIFNTAIMILSSFLFDVSYQLITPYYSFWYLTALVFWRLTIKYMDKLKDLLFISIIAALLIGFWGDVTNVLSISRIIAFYPFFIAGYKLPSEKIFEVVNKRKKTDIFKSTLLLFITLFVSLYFINKIEFITLNHLTMSSYGSIYDMFVRLIIFFIAVAMTIAILNLTPQRPISLISKWGKNSLSIYVLHRFITFIFIKAFPTSNYSNLYILNAVLVSVITLTVLGTNYSNDVFHLLINKIIAYLECSIKIDKNHKKYKLRKFIAMLLFTVYLMIPMIVEPIKVSRTKSETQDSIAIHEVMTAEHINAIENSVSIAFVGDLILLQKQVRGAYDENLDEYNFSPMFEQAKKYLTEADLAIGVFEGPMAGEKTGYTIGNYDDGLPLYLNFPDSFAKAVKESGIDLVSTANNHLLDKGETGTLRTLDVLDKNALLHVGSYRDSKEKDSVMIVERNGIRIGVLAYTFASNGHSDEFFVKENPSITSLIVAPDSKYFKEVKNQVLSDFKKIEGMDNPPDLILVMPHMGTQFIHETDNYQKTWNEIFINAGADIIFGDHSHAVQPIEYKSVKNKDGSQKNAVIVNCPGNFANSYVENDGDATSIAEIYIDPNSKKVIAASIVPMYTQAVDEFNYRALPIYDILNDDALNNEISPYEIKRVKEVNEIVTSVMIETEISLDQAQNKYYLFPEGYFRQPTKPIQITEEMKKSEIYKLINESKTICFVGDSITAGSRNGGYGWYEPLMAVFEGKTVYRAAWDSATTKTLLENSDKISAKNADIYVIAIGTNDVRYRDKKTCAMDSETYVKNINTLIEKITTLNKNAKFVLISPWLALNNDPYSKLEIEKRDAMLKEYGERLEIYSEKNGYLFIDANEAIYNEMQNSSTEKYMVDHIHPNANEGIKLYSKKVLLGN